MPDFGGGGQQQAAQDQSAAYNQAAQIQAEAATKAAEMQLQASREANALTKEMYQTGRADLAPWKAGGQIALDAYMALMGLPSIYTTTIPGVPGQTYPTTTTNAAASGGGGAGTTTFNLQSGGYVQNPDGSYSPFQDTSGGYYADDAGNIYPRTSIMESGGQWYYPKEHWITSSDGSFGGSAGVEYIPVKPTALTPGGPTITSTGYSQPQASNTGAATAGQILTNYQNAMAHPSQRVNATEWIKQTPGYEFQLGEGLNALDRTAAAKGKLMSGQQYRAVSEYGQNYALGHYDNYMNRLASLAGLGQSTAGQTASAGQNMATQSAANTMTGASNAAQMNMASAQAIGSGYVNAANALAANQNQGTSLGGVIGGGLSGAAMGYGIGNLPGALIGGTLGAIGSIFK